MSNIYENAEALMNAILAKLPFAEKDDLSILADIMQNLEMLAADDALPPAFQNQAKRTAQLAEKVIMAESPFESGMSKLSQSIEKMMKGLEEIKSKSAPAGDKTVAYEEPLEQSIPDDLKELIVKFASQQQQVLEDFEGLCLDFENKSDESEGGIKRILHTWKGEFGVLSLQKYSQLIHEIEEKLGQGAFPSDSLFRLKDFLAEKMNLLAGGEIPEITPQERESLFQSPETGSPAATKLQKRKAAVRAVKPEPEKSTQEPVQKPAPKPDALAPMIIDPSLIADFIAESREHIDNAEPLLLELEEDPANSEHLNTIFRACHTIKGVAGFIGFDEIKSLAHSMENMLDMARKNELVLTAAHIDILLMGMDCLREFIKSAEGTLSGAQFAVPENFQLICRKLNTPHEIALELPEQSTKKMGEILVERGLATPEDVEKALDKQKEGDPRKMGEILIQENKIPPRSVAGALASQSAAKQGKANVEETIRVPVERLDQLVDSIGEAVIAQSMVYADLSTKNLNDRSLDKKMSQATLIMRQIQELSMSLRMVSLKSTFQKMARLVRDLSQKTNKLVDLVLEGEDTELDKTVVENIGDPLIHMIRNSMDHGIESAEDRKKAGKPERAKVTLRAYHRAGSVVIDVQDDGKGLDKEAILKKAIDKSLAKADANYTEQEIYQYIFLPGFSTAKVVTDVSGRGVGMDVVKRNISSLRGSVEINSEVGKGTCFSIKLPLTLAIIDGMVVRIDKEQYIIPTLSIVESLKPKPEHVEKILEKGEVVKVRDSLYTLVRFSKLFDSGADGKAVTDGIVMIVEDMLGKKVGLCVDDILGQQQVVIKSLGDTMKQIPGVAGGAIMSDGSVSLILDIGGIVKMATA